VAEKAARTEVTLQAGDVSVVRRRAELGFATDEGALRSGILGALGSLQKRPRSWSADVVQAFQLARGTPGAQRAVELEPQIHFDASPARRVLADLAARAEREPADAELVIAEHRIVPSRPGSKLSVDASLERLRERGAREEFVEFELQEIQPDVTEDDLAPVDVTQVLSSYETSFLGKAGPRAVNIGVAARFLNGAVILPGETLSFNSRVGRRLHGRGFVDAPVIGNDDLDEDVGGGVCQVATTLHAAAILGDLRVIERRSHSRPSGYAPIGLDATVMDGKVDLRLQNPYPEALLVHAFTPRPFVIRVELLGSLPKVVVQHSASAITHEPFGRRVWHKPETPPGSFVQKQKGSPGMEVVSVVIARQGGREVSRRRYTSKYYPVPEVFYVGDGFLTANLPPPPTGAIGLTIDGEDVAPARALAAPNSHDMTRAPTIDEANGISPDSTAHAN
jgi:vancomycin resistance protein YoaR